MEQLFNQKVLNTNNVFDGSFLDAKNIYLSLFNQLPSINFMNKIDGEKAFAAIRQQYASVIEHVYTYRWYKREKKQYQFDKTILILSNRCLLELDEDYCEMLHDGSDEVFIQGLTTLLTQFKERHRRQPLEINLIVQNRGALDLKAMEIKRTGLNLDMFYEDDFKEVDAVIR